MGEPVGIGPEIIIKAREKLRSRIRQAGRKAKQLQTGKTDGHENVLGEPEIVWCATRFRACFALYRDRQDASTLAMHIRVRLAEQNSSPTLK